MSWLERWFGNRTLEAQIATYTETVRAQLRRLAPQLRAADVDDLVQEVRIRLWQVLKAERKIDQPASYLKKVVLTATIDALRRDQSRGGQQVHLSWDDVLLDSVPTDDPDVTERAAARQAVEALESRLDHFDADAARALRLYALGYTTLEIGQTLGWTEAKARNLVYRTLKTLTASEPPP